MKLYNTLSRQTEVLKPLHDNSVSFYSCGLTVYSQPHIGNWVGYIYWDVLTRALQAEGYTVNRTQNYTDVGHLTSDDDNGEDKMEKGARREGITAWDVAERYIAVAEHEAYELLDLRRPTHVVRATSLIAEQIAFVQDLEAKGLTYTIPEEGVYFDTSKLSDYGKLARLDIDGLEAGARVAVAGKRNNTDFAVWKFSPNGQKRDMEWESPWGTGFPGWHLECSVIARQTLGDQIDIHSGGIDHIPVHHTNEIAQTESVTGKSFAQMWVHNNHLKVDGGKMAKSLGNIYTMQDIIDRGYSLDAFKLFVLSRHYRTEGNFTWENLTAAQNRLNNWRAFAALQHQVMPDAAHSPTELRTYVAHSQSILHDLQEDLHTPAVLTAIDAVISSRTSALTPDELPSFKAYLAQIDMLLGLHLSTVPALNPSQQTLVRAREAARQAKDWTASDTLRDTLAAEGIGVNDTPNGTIWYWL